MLGMTTWLKWYEDRFGIFSTVTRIRKLSLLLVVMLRIPNRWLASFLCPSLPLTDDGEGHLHHHLLENPLSRLPDH